MSFGQILYYVCTMTGNLLRRLKKINKKDASSENLTKKKMNIGPSLYYGEFGSYDFPKIKSCLMQIS